MEVVVVVATWRPGDRTKVATSDRWARWIGQNVRKGKARLLPQCGEGEPKNEVVWILAI